ncbi:metal ABC transporter solute-binding protein, Zn/Mn family [Subtercola sp. YIM 133946]|uniref:metal ABC transporter solute-binding protein, Zn/Mn family n=1 Tax=Subtercola sp. YIM 133946 TaxID=3118909 RepID=UPI002F950CD6
MFRQSPSPVRAPSWRQVASIGVPVVVGISAIAFVLSGGATGSAVASAAAGAPTSAEQKATLSVVASTSVYGDIAHQIGGDLVSVTSIIDDPDRDPHEYQADGQNQLSISKADIVIENGAGYDDFIDTMLSSSKNTHAVVLNAATISGYDLGPAAGDLNEHLWYDFATMTKVADEVADSLGDLDPAGSATYRANAAAFTAELTSLSATEAQLRTTYAGRGVAITEPVPLYLLQSIGLVDETPSKFSDAVENGTDVAPDVLAQTTALFAGHDVVLLAYNAQTAGAQTDQVVAAARAASVPVVGVTETLPQGESYLQWMTGNLAAVAAALAE